MKKLTVNQELELIKTLNEMEDSLEIYKTNKDNFMLFENSWNSYKWCSIRSYCNWWYGVWKENKW